MTRTQKLRIALIVAVCAAQFYTSARDIVDVAMPIVHHDLSRAVTFPACIDLMILVATLTAASPRGVNRKARMWALAGRYIGFGFTIYCNALASGIAHVDQVTSSIVLDTILMLAPPLALICTVELAIHGAQGTPASRKAASRPSATVTQLRAAN